jgi:formate C-acetyltransferase
MPEGFRHFASKVAIDTSSLQFESDEIMRRTWGDDGAIACCVSPMRVGKQMQFFGARANLAKCLLYAINGGRDEVSGEQIAPASEPVQGEYLDFDDVIRKFETTMDWLADVYVNAMNVIHYMHDKYAYERLEMALHDYAPLRTMAFGMAGMSVVSDSLSAIKFAKVRVIRDQTGLVTDYQTELRLGNHDNRVDQLAVWSSPSRSHRSPDVCNAVHTQSVLDHVERRTAKIPATRPTAGAKVSRSRRRQPDAGRDSHVRLSGVGRQDLPRRRGRFITTTVVPSGLGADDRRNDRCRRVLRQHCT